MGGGSVGAARVGVGAVAGDDGPIGGGEVEGDEFFGLHPADLDVFEGGGGGAVGSEVADERKHLDHDARVVVEEGLKGAGDDGGAAEFFGEFAEEGGGVGFAGLDLAAGKFPFETEVFVGGALGDEDAAGTVFEHGADDGDGRRSGKR